MKINESYANEILNSPEFWESYRKDKEAEPSTAAPGYIDTYSRIMRCAIAWLSCRGHEVAVSAKQTLQNENTSTWTSESTFAVHNTYVATYTYISTNTSTHASGKVGALEKVTSEREAVLFGRAYRDVMFSLHGQ